MKIYSSPEVLECRIAPATILITGVAGDDLLTVVATSAESGTYQLNDGPVVPFSGATKFEFHGGDGDDTLTIVNPDGSVFAPVDGIVCAGEAHRTSTGDQLVMTGGGGSTFVQEWTLGATPDAGTFVLTDGVLRQTIQYSGLEPIVDTVVAASLTINGNANANIINYVASPTAGRGLIGVDNAETTDFANKTTLIINGGGGADTIFISNPGAPTGLTGGITVNGGDPIEGDILVCTGAVGQLDNLRHDPTNLGAGTVINDSAPQPTVTYTGIEKVRLFVQQADGDSVRADGTAGDDRFEFWPGATPDSGIIRGTIDQNNATGVGPFAYTETEFFGSSSATNDVDFNFFIPGGIDTFIYNGTVNNDGLVVTGGEAGGLDVSNSINGTKIARFELFNISSVLINGGGASDTLNFTSNTPATTLDLGTATIGGMMVSGKSVPVAYSDIGQVNLNGSGGASSLTVNGTAFDDTINVTPTGPGAGNLVRRGVGSSPQFTYTGMGAASGLTVNGGAGGFDVLGLLGSAGADTVTSTATTITSNGGIVTFGTGVEGVELTMSGGDDNVTLLTFTGAAAVIHGDEGNDTLTGTTLSDLIYGGAGNDVLIGGGGADTSYGEDGDDRFGDPAVRDPAANDPGNDSFFGGAGSDIFFWDPGDGDDLIEGGAGDSDQLFFSGNAGAEQFFLFADTVSPSRFHLFRVQAAIDIDAGDLEEVNLATLGGTDNVTVGRSDLGVPSDLSTTTVRTVDISLGGDGAADSVLFEGRPFTDNLLVSVSGATVKVAGGSYDVRIDGSDPTMDRLTVSANEGDDTVVAEAGVAAVIGITLNGGTGNDFLSADGIINGNDGDDTLVGGAGNNALDGGAGDDTFLGNGGTYAIGGGVGASFGDIILMEGTEIADSVVLTTNVSGHLVATINGVTSTYTNFLGGPFATSGIERVDVFALGENDLVDLSAYTATPTRVFGGDGDDLLIGSPQDDLLDGGAGRDVLRGGGGNNTLLNHGTFGFTAPTALDVGKAPTAVATGDLNGDPFADLVVVNSGSGTVSVLLGAGNGRFQDPVNFSTAGKKPASIAIGDFSGDGKLDLAVANSGSKTVAILLGDGTGAFATATTFATGKKPVDLHTANLDGDLNLDLVFIAGTSVSTLTGAGDGTFSGLQSFATSGTKPVALTVGDFNLDGFADIATANNGSKNVSLLTGTGTGFNDAVKFKTGKKPSALVAGDFDRDGALDLAVTNAGSRFISVLIGNGGAGSAQFDRQLKIAAPGITGPAGITTADLDGDGLLDLAVSNATTGSFSVLLGLGSGSFTAPTLFSLGGDPKTKPGALVVGDFDGDGAPDLAIAGSGTADVSIALTLAG